MDSDMNATSTASPAYSAESALDSFLSPKAGHQARQLKSNSYLDSTISSIIQSTTNRSVVNDLIELSSSDDDEPEEESTQQKQPEPSPGIQVMADHCDNGDDDDHHRRDEDELDEIEAIPGSPNYAEMSPKSLFSHCFAGEITSTYQFHNKVRQKLILTRFGCEVTR